MTWQTHYFIYCLLLIFIHQNGREYTKKRKYVVITKIALTIGSNAEHIYSIIAIIYSIVLLLKY